MLKRILNKIKRESKKIKFYKKIDHQKIFTKIYLDNIWGQPKSESPFYSGTGSDEEYAKIYAFSLTKFIIENNITSMVDLGCGDFRVGSKILNDVNIDYIGVDIVPDLIDYNNQNFYNNNITFRCLNIVKDILPIAELCTIRQVLQHLSNNDIKRVLKKCKDYKYLIITEHLPCSDSLIPNIDKLSDENIRLINNSGVYLDKPPFNLKVKELLTVYPEVEKGSKIVTFLVSNL
jgi:SAM-dependent methyltransferase